MFLSQKSHRRWEIFAQYIRGNAQLKESSFFAISDFLIFAALDRKTCVWNDLNIIKRCGGHRKKMWWSNIRHNQSSCERRRGTELRRIFNDNRRRIRVTPCFPVSCSLSWNMYSSGWTVIIVGESHAEEGCNHKCMFGSKFLKIEANPWYGSSLLYLPVSFCFPMSRSR